MVLPVMLDKKNVTIIWNDRIFLIVFMVFKYSGLFIAHIAIIYQLESLTSFKKSL